MEEKQVILEAIIKFIKASVGWYGTTAQLAKQLQTQNIELKDIVRNSHQISSILRHSKDVLFIRDVHFSHVRMGSGGKRYTMLWYGSGGAQLAMNYRWQIMRKAGRPCRVGSQTLGGIEQEGD